jgi:CheY-like chemotaxis protein
MHRNNRKILIVEDEAMVAMVMRWSVENMGYTVCDSVATGEDAVRAAREAKPDLILMDVHLPGPLSGIEAAKQISAHQEASFIFFTGYSEGEITEQAHPVEPVACLSKPVENTRLAAILSAFFDGEAPDGT